MSILKRFFRWLRRQLVGFTVHLRWTWRRLRWLTAALFRAPAAATRGLWQLARGRFVGIMTGWLLIFVGTIIGPVPGPWSIPLVALGTVMILRRSRWARRRFVRLSQRYPRIFGPVRRFIARRRSPRRAAATA